MDFKMFQKLCDEAKKDPKFFHQLVFDTENALAKAPYIDRKTKGALLTVNPQDVIRFMVREAAGCGGDYTCSCTSGTCGGSTCGGSTCDVTCSGDSCGNTCGDSCGYTTNLTKTPWRGIIGNRFNGEIYLG